MENTLLREAIRKEFKTDAAFGLAIGWVPTKVYKTLRCGYIPKLSEAVTMSRALNISLDELASFYTN